MRADGDKCVPAFERRTGASDRRRTARGGRRAADRARLGGVVGLLVFVTLSGSGARGAGPEPMRFGVDIGSVEAAASLGARMSYGAFWVGSWTQKSGWSDLEQQLRWANQRSVTPVIEWWYWGDDISPACVENGCWDARQGVWKDKATWYRMSSELADVVARRSGGREVVVVVENEFNKNGIETYEPFDGYLVDQMAILHRTSNIKVVVAFGNWGRESWSRFDRAVAATDLIGTELLQSSVRNASTYPTAVDALIGAGSYLQAAFGKPLLVIDLGLSSYPEPEYERNQAAEIGELFARMAELKAAGIRGIVWRSLVDDPRFDTSNYHGIAERYWGLVRADGTAKSALAIFVNGVAAEIGASRAPGGPTGLRIVQ